MEILGGNKQSGASEWDELANASAEVQGNDRVAELRRALADIQNEEIEPEFQDKTRDAVMAFEERQGREITRSEMRAIMRAEASYYGVVKRDASGNLYNNAGKVFEKGLSNLIIEEFGYKEERNGMFATKVRDESTRVSNIAEDVLEGADVMVYRLPVDITLNREKGGEIGSVDEDGEVVEGFRTMGNLGGVRVSSGFRKTNGGVHKLSTPVCVMLFESEGRMEVDEMLDAVRRHKAEFREITDDALASYWDYADAMEDAA